MSETIYDGIQCGRCGSSMGWEDCEGCDDGTYEDEGDCLEPTVYRTCPACGGKGGWWVCLSDYGDEPTWCDGNPRPGRIRVPCSSVEEFACHADGTTTYKRGPWEELIEESLVPIGDGHHDESVTRDRDQASTQAIGPDSAD